MARRRQSSRSKPIALALAVAVAAGAATLAARRARQGAGGSTGGEAAGEPSAEPTVWVCACGAEYRVVGAGRHQVRWTVDAPEDQPVLEDHCPACERPWPETVSGEGVTSPAA
jgi:hypothetical protein